MNAARVLALSQGETDPVRSLNCTHGCEQNQPLTRPATADESAVAGRPLPKGEG